jgi:hypothetical protein
MRRALVPLVALAGVACSRDLEMPSSSPPRVDSVQVLGLEAKPAHAAPLPVLGGELLVLRGGGFPADPTQLQVELGSEDAPVLDATVDRVVVRVPELAASGTVDLLVGSPVGTRTLPGAVRYDGPGKPAGLGTSDLPTSVPLGFVAPVQPPSSTGFHDLAIAIGAADSALVVVPAIGVAVTTIPLGLVPGSAAARVVNVGGNAKIEVLALARGGEAALGTAVLAGTSVASRVQAKPLPTSVLTQACTFPQIMFTNGNTPVAAWVNDAGAQRIAVIDMPAATAPSGAEYKPVAGSAHTVPPISGWAAWQGNSVVFATNDAIAGPEIYVYDASNPSTPPTPLTVNVGGLGTFERVDALVESGCPATTFIYTLTAATSGGASALAVAYKAGDGDRVALVNMTPGPGAGEVQSGLAGTVPTSLALVPEPPFGAPPAFAVLAAGITNLYRFRPLGGPACGDLVPDAALPLSATPGVLPTFGGMITVADGTRLLATTPEFDLITVLPPSLTSAGPVFRLASYGGVTIQPANIGGGAFPIAVAEHASTGGNLSGLDTGSALLVVSLAGDQGSVALGGSGYGRGAVWIEGGGAGALAYTGQLPSSGSAVFERAGAAAVTGFSAGTCPSEDVRITGTRPVANGSDLVAQGPARAGVLGPDGVGRYGPATPPVYTSKDTTLAVYVPGPGNAACLAGTNPNWDATFCPPDSTVDLGVTPLDVTLSAGDFTAAVRSLETDLGQCTQAAGFPAPGSCGQDLLCLRASCPPAKSLHLARAGAAPVALPLPARPAGIAADRAGGFLVTLPCAAGAAAGGECFPADPLCASLQTGPGGAEAALVLVAEDGSGATCLAVLPGLAGPIAVTPNGEEAWVTGSAFGAQILTRLALTRRTSDGAIDATLPARRVTAEALGLAADVTGAFPPGGVAFTSDGATGIVTVPGEFRILLYQ